MVARQRSFTPVTERIHTRVYCRELEACHGEVPNIAHSAANNWRVQTSRTDTGIDIRSIGRLEERRPRFRLGQCYSR